MATSQTLQQLRAQAMARAALAAAAETPNTHVTEATPDGGLVGYSEDAPRSTHRTFVHQVAGANVIMPDGRKLVFYGKTTLASKGQTGGHGFYRTDRPEEIEILAYLVSVPTSQVTELVEDKVTHREKLVYKQQDPALQEAADDAAKNSERFYNPAASAVVENLGAHIASGMAADHPAQ